MAVIKPTRNEIVAAYNKEIKTLRSEESKAVAALKAWEKANLDPKADAAALKKNLSVKALAEYENVHKAATVAASAVRARTQKFIAALRRAV